MRFQTTGYNCGPNAVDNALEAYGEHYRDEEATMRLCRTTSRGTGEIKIREALKKRRHKTRAWNTTDQDQAIDKLFNALINGWPVILAVDRDEHWVAAMGVLGTEVIAVDSENSYCNRERNGIHYYSRAQLLRRWRNKKGKYFGLVVFPRGYKG